MMMQRPMYKAGGRTKKMSEAQKQALLKEEQKLREKQVSKMMLPGAALCGSKKRYEKVS